MTDHLTEDEVLAAIPGLTRIRLTALVETEMVIPLQGQRDGTLPLVFRPIDCARIQLLCDLAEDLDLDTATLEVVIGLIDQLHAQQQDLLGLARAIAAEPADVRARIGAAILAFGR